MPPNVYLPTPLPARLNLDDLDTRKQLQAARQDSKTPAHVGTAAVISEPPRKATSPTDRDRLLRDKLNLSGKKVIEDDLADFLESERVQGRRGEFRKWLRRFHNEYDDSWFDSNFTRLENAFKPTWVRLVGESPKITPAADLLDFWDAPNQL